MPRRSRSLRYRYLVDSAVVIAAYLASFIQQLIYSVAIVVGLVLIVGITTYYEYQETKIQSESEELRVVLEEEMLPEVVEDYNESYPGPDPPDVRTNVMLLRRRNINPLIRERSGVYPWERTLMIEASCGDYEGTREDELEWKTNEGVVGRAMNERAQEIWADLDYELDERIIAGWNITEEQASRTAHLKPLLSVPIYLPSDSKKINPVGVLNVDSEATPEVSKFDDKEIRDNVIRHANISGAIIE